MSSVIANIGYNSISRVLTICFQVLTATLLARTLSPEDFGLVGIATIITGFVGQLGNLGLLPALVQRRNLDEKVEETAHTLNIVLAGSLFLCAQIAAPLSRFAFDNAEVPRMVSVLAFSFLIASPGFLPSALLTRDMQFARLRAPAVAGVLVRGLVAVGCAFAGMRYWSVVAGGLAASLITSILLKVVRPCRTRWRFNREIAGELLRYGAPLLGTGLLVFSLFNADNFLIGSMMGTEQLGYYTVAFTWSSFVCTTISETVHTVLFPQFSRMNRSNLTDLAEMYCRSLRAILFLAALGNAVLFAVADGFLFSVLGKGSARWGPALSPLQILCVYGIIRAGVEPIGNVIMALGKTRLMLWANLLAVVPQLCLLPFVIPRWGISGVACLVCASYSIQWVLYGPFLERELSIGGWRFIKLIFPSLAGAVSGVLLASEIPLFAALSWKSMVLKATVVSVSFILMHELLTRGSMLAEVNRLLKRSRPSMIPIPEKQRV